eukprot:156423_1
MSKRTLCIPPTPFGLFLLIISMITALLLLNLLGYSIVVVSKLKLPKMFSIVYWLTIFVLFIAGISMPINVMFNFEFSGYCNDLNRVLATAPLAIGSYLISLSCVCCLYLVRFIETFKHSPHFTLSLPIYILFIFGILIQFILAVLTVNYIRIFWLTLANNPGQHRKIQKPISYLLLSFTMVNIVYNIGLLYLFLKTVFILKKNINRQNEINLLIKPCVIYTLCLILSFVSTLTSTMYGVIRTNFIVEDTNELHLMRLTLITLDVFINTVSVNLQFKDAQKRCNKYCKCKCCSYVSNVLYSFYSGSGNGGNESNGSNESNDEDIGIEMIELTSNCTTNCTTRTASGRPNLVRSVTPRDTSTTIR